MADNRKYYYLKLKENFFDSDSIAVSYTHLDVYKRQGFYRYLNVAALPSSLIPTPPDDEQSPGIFHLQEDFE